MLASVLNVEKNLPYQAAWSSLIVHYIPVRSIISSNMAHLSLQMGALFCLFYVISLGPFSVPDLRYQMSYSCPCQYVWYRYNVPSVWIYYVCYIIGTLVRTKSVVLNILTIRISVNNDTNTSFE